MLLTCLSLLFRQFLFQHGMKAPINSYGVQLTGAMKP